MKTCVLSFVVLLSSLLPLNTVFSDDGTSGSFANDTQAVSAEEKQTTSDEDKQTTSDGFF